MLKFKRGVITFCNCSECPRIKRTRTKDKVKEELKADFNILDARHLHTFEIPFALPKLESPSNTMQFDVDAKTIEAGDFLLNGSQNVACKVGEELADYILKDAKCLN